MHSNLHTTDASIAAKNIYSEEAIRSVETISSHWCSSSFPPPTAARHLLFLQLQLPDSFLAFQFQQFVFSWFWSNQLIEQNVGFDFLAKHTRCFWCCLTLVLSILITFHFWWCLSWNYNFFFSALKALLCAATVTLHVLSQHLLLQTSAVIDFFRCWFLLCKNLKSSFQERKTTVARMCSLFSPHVWSP